MKRGLSSISSLVVVSGILFVLGFLANFVTYTFVGQTLNQWLETITGVPAENLVFPNILWMMILPFLATGAILMFLLDKVMHVSDEYGLIIAIAWAGILFNPAFPVYLLLLPFYGAAGIFGPIVFTAVFIIGVHRWYNKSRMLQESTVGAFQTNIEKKHAQLETLGNKLAEAKTAQDRAKIGQQIEQVRRQLEVLKKEQEKVEAGV